MDTAALVLTCDTTHAEPLYVFLHSLEKNGGLENTKFDLYLFTPDITDLKYSPYKVNLVEVDPAVYHELDTSKLNHNQRNTPFINSAALRLLAMEELRNKYKTLVYFDVDIIINGDVSALFKEPTAPLSGVAEKEDYVNSGVLVCDLTHPLYKNIHKDFIKTPSLKFFDQDFINDRFQGEIDFLPRTYNSRVDFYSENQNEERKFQKKAKVQHFMHPSKPWHELPDTLNLDSKKERAILTKEKYYTGMYNPLFRLPYEDYFTMVLGVLEHLSDSFIKNTHKYANAKLDLMNLYNTESEPKTGKVVYGACDRTYLGPYKAMMLSLHENGNLPEVDYALFSPDITYEEIENLPQSIRICRVPDNDFKTDTDGKPFQNCMLKIEAISELAESYGQALYLDADIIINDSIADLLDDIGDHDLRVVPEFPYAYHYQKETTWFKRVHTAMQINWRHFNSGVMVINLNTADCFVGGLTKIPTWRDQEYMNAYFRDANIDLLPLKFNWRPEAYGKIPDHVLEDHMSCRNTANIIHFAGKAKPWLDNQGCNAYELEQLSGLL